MSRFEQNRSADSETASKNVVFKNGTQLAKPKRMKRSITSKEITILVGILVAIVVALTMWVADPETQSYTHSSVLPKINPVAIKNLIQMGLKVVF
jgi:hypothetical protein